MATRVGAVSLCCLAFGSPEERLGDIHLFSYIFNGDFVDRGKHGLEVFCLLLALKIRYPSRVFLIRGNHEQADLNLLYGFFAECTTRVDGGEKAFALFQQVGGLDCFISCSFSCSFVDIRLAALSGVGDR
jgi:hypothetical protein